MAPTDTLHLLLRDAYRQSLEPVTARLFDLAGVGPGQRVLDIGTGSGETALLAAERVGPHGSVVATDISLEAMRGLVERLAVGPESQRVALEVTTAETLAHAPASFDVALARNCAMYFADLPLACRNVNALLRPGGRFVVSVYGPLEQEPFHSIPIAAVQKRCRLRAPYPEYVQAFRVGADSVEQALRQAGFDCIERHAVAVARTFPSVEAAVAALQSSRSLGELLARLPAGQIADAWAEVADGFRAFASTAGLRLPGQQVVLGATKRPA